MDQKSYGTLHKCYITWLVISIIVAIALIVFSCIDIPNSITWMLCLGIALLVLGIIYLIIYALSRRGR